MFQVWSPLPPRLMAQSSKAALAYVILRLALPMTADTVVWIASMTKAVTGACAMQLVERGKLSLDAPIKTVLPDLGRVQVLEGYDGTGTPKLRAPRRELTLRHLLTHTAGYAYDIFNADMARYMEKTNIPDIISCTNAALTIPLLFDPDTASTSIGWARRSRPFPARSSGAICRRICLIRLV